MGTITAVPARPNTVGLADRTSRDRALALAETVLLGGGSVVLPTDTVYGLAALPSVPGATSRLFELKDRAAERPLAVLVSDVHQARGLVEVSGPDVERWMADLWPGPLTIVLPRSDAARGLELGSGPSTVGVRCPDHEFVRLLAARVGPLATTSANRSGEATPVDAASAASSLTGQVDLVVDGGPAGTVASTVVEVVGGRVRILREGAVAAAALLRSSA